MSTEMNRESRLAPWQDVSLAPEQRVAAVIAEMTLREKVAQLYGVWVGVSSAGGDVAPFQHEMDDAIDFDELIRHGLGQLTRPFGTAPVDAAVGVLSLARTQCKIVASSRLGIPALAHEECLAGFTAWGATAYPVPLSWGATFNPEVVEAMAARIGASMRSVGVHQGLAPVLDVTRDPRWGPDRGDHRGGPLPGRHGGQRLHPGPPERRHHRHAEALRRLLGVQGRAQPRAGVDRTARVRRRPSCPRSRWRSARRASAARCTPTSMSTAFPPPPIANC